MIEQIIICLFTIPCRLKKIECHHCLLKKDGAMLCPTKNYVVGKQTTKQIITCHAQQKNM